MRTVHRVLGAALVPVSAVVLVGGVVMVVIGAIRHRRRPRDGVGLLLFGAAALMLPPMLAFDLWLGP